MKNYFTYIQSPTSYNFELLMYYYLSKKHNWKKIDKNSENIAHWCYKSENSVVKRYPYFSPFTRKDLVFSYLNHTDIIPETYLLQNGQWKPRKPVSKNCVWFCKHPYRDGSRGIIVAKSLHPFIQQSLDQPTYNFVIQPTIPRPWLDQNKYKCDIRIWGVVTQDNNRLNLHVFRIGTLRTNPGYYQELSDRLDHQLTNSCYFRKKKNLDNLIREFNDQEMIYKTSFRKIIKQFQKIWSIYRPILLKNKNPHLSLELFGFDFLCNQDGQPFFIEANRKPNYHTFKRYRQCVETMIPTILEPLIQKKPFPHHPLWIKF